MTALFADTFYWVALTDLRDSSRGRAAAFARERADSLIISTDEVLAEYLTFFAAAPEQLRRKAVINVHGILEDPHVRVIPQSHESFLAGLDLYRAQPDNGYSLVDCISMHTMRKEGLTEVLTNDRHFEQEGFRALFRDS